MLLIPNTTASMQLRIPGTHERAKHEGAVTPHTPVILHSMRYVYVTNSLYSLPMALCCCFPGHRYIELFLYSCDEPSQQLPPPGPAAPTGGPLPMRGAEGGAGRFMPLQQHQPTWGDQRGQVREGKGSHVSLAVRY